MTEKLTTETKYTSLTPVRLPKALKEAAAKLAAENGLTLTDLVVNGLRLQVVTGPLNPNALQEKAAS